MDFVHVSSETPNRKVYGVVYSWMKTNGKQREKAKFLVTTPITDDKDVAKAIGARYLDLLCDAGDGWGIYGDEEGWHSKESNIWFPNWRGSVILIKEDESDTILPFEWTQTLEKDVFGSMWDGDGFVVFNIFKQQ